jgi:hypothetical protein
MNLGSGHRGDQFAAPSRQTSSAARGWYLAIPDHHLYKYGRLE